MPEFPVTRAGAILAVSDFASSLRFYRDQLGLTEVARYDDPPYATLTAAEPIKNSPALIRVNFMRRVLVISGGRTSTSLGMTPAWIGSCHGLRSATRF